MERAEMGCAIGRVYGMEFAFERVAGCEFDSQGVPMLVVQVFNRKLYTSSRLLIFSSDVLFFQYCLYCLYYLCSSPVVVVLSSTSVVAISPSPHPHFHHSQPSPTRSPRVNLPQLDAYPIEAGSLVNFMDPPLFSPRIQSVSSSAVRIPQSLVSTSSYCYCYRLLLVEFIQYEFNTECKSNGIRLYNRMSITEVQATEAIMFLTVYADSLQIIKESARRLHETHLIQSFTDTMISQMKNPLFHRIINPFDISLTGAHCKNKMDIVKKVRMFQFSHYLFLKYLPEYQSFAGNGKELIQYVRTQNDKIMKSIQ